jgi:hypothetical protein
MKRLALIIALFSILTIATPVMASSLPKNETKLLTMTLYTSTNIFPNATGNYTTLNPVGEADNWNCVDDPILTPDDGSTFVGEDGTTQDKDAYNLTTPTFIGDNQTITSVTVYFRHQRNTGTTGTIQPFLRLSSNETAGTVVTSNATWVTSSQILSRPGGGIWITSDFTDLQVCIGLQDATGVEWCTQVYVHIEYAVEESKAPGYAVSGNISAWIPTPNYTANFTTTLNPLGPLSKIINAISTAGSTPSQLPYILIAGVILIAVSYTVSWGLRTQGSGSLFIKGTVVFALMAIFAGMKWLDVWMLIFFLIFAVSFAMGSRHQSWSG